MNSESVNKQLLHCEYQRPSAKFPIAMLADDIAVPMNVGSVFRLCDALGVEKLFLTGTSPDPSNPKVVKTSRATEHHVAHEYHNDALSVMHQLKQSGYIFIALEITSHSVDLRSLDYAGMEKICLVVGAENTGVKQSLLDCCDYTVHIPMRGNNSSMNVATACAIALHEMTRRFP